MTTVINGYKILEFYVFIITFEAGRKRKSLQTRALYRKLRLDIPVILIHEPAALPLAKTTRLLKWAKAQTYHVYELMLSMLPARSCSRGYQPALKAGEIVICDPIPIYPRLFRVWPRIDIETIKND